MTVEFTLPSTSWAAWQQIGWPKNQWLTPILPMLPPHRMPIHATLSTTNGMQLPTVKPNKLAANTADDDDDYNKSGTKKSQRRKFNFKSINWIFIFSFIGCVSWSGLSESGDYKSILFEFTSAYIYKIQYFQCNNDLSHRNAHARTDNNSQKMHGGTKTKLHHSLTHNKSSLIEQ